ncbi:hypothetical protein AAE478_001203 [Parahypoxylon ruwenzoriense]
MPQFSNTLAGEQPPEREQVRSRDYSNTDEWDASKTPPSRFQKRKGSIYATPSSRDGHVERNRDAVEEFHKAHSKRWSVSSSGSNGGGGGGGGGGRRASVGAIVGALAKDNNAQTKTSN